MTTAIRRYHTYILSENVPMNTNRRLFGDFCLQTASAQKHLSFI